MAGESPGTLFLKPTQLQITWPDGRQETYPLTKPVTLIGRSGGNDLDLPDEFKSISRQHLEIRRQAPAVYQLRDLESTNGVLVNGVRVTEAQLKRRLLDGFNFCNHSEAFYRLLELYFLKWVSGSRGANEIKNMSHPEF